MLKFCLLLSYYIALSCAADCSSTTCPTNGIWSEWTTTDECDTSCGACSKLQYTRKCLSSAMNGCSCVGSTTATMECNTQACNWPRTGANGTTCCKGTPMIYNNWYHCGPLAINNTLTCCPAGGYWSTWSSWSKASDVLSWSRSRSCISGGYACPCSGDSVETKYSCPCKAVTLINGTDNSCSSVLSGMTPYTVRTPINLSSECLAVLVLEASNFRKVFYTNQGGKIVTWVGAIDSSGTCTKMPFETGTVGTNGLFYKQKFTCDLSTGYFTGGGFNNIVSLAQFS
uniref:Uncharacterized protein n=1 Tax=Caenorhabditis japonica TaxID=281687 RepID=A0A8R1HRR9_CAEJA